MTLPNGIPQVAQRLSLAQTPTPIQKLSRFSEELGREIWVKRDDLTGLELSGNKVRKLEYLLADAREKGATMLITCGGVQSNHARATAIAGRKLGMKTWALLRGSPEMEIDGNLFLLKLTGARVKWCSQEEYLARNSMMAEMAAEARSDDEVPYVIPEGGSNALGALGYVQAMGEIEKENRDRSLDFDTLVCAVGSGGTLAGLSAGASILKSRIRVLGFNVCDTAEYFEAAANSIQESIAAQFGLEEATGQNAKVIDGFVGPGYALSGKGDHEMISKMAHAEGLILDPAYTAKAFYGLSKSVLANHPDFGQRILFLHSGGSFGLFPHRSSFF